MKKSMLFIKPFLVALQFLTRIPVVFVKKPSDLEIAQSVLFYPVVGLLIGIVLTVLNYHLYLVSDFLRASIVVIVWVVITGALHIDGLADSVDAWAGGLGNKEKTLAIMKDPNCGPMGVVAIVLLILIKFSVVASIPPGNILILIFVPVLARSIILLLFLTTAYAREKGIASEYFVLFLHKANIIVLILVAALSLLILQVHAMIVVSIVVLVFAYLRWVMVNRIGGFTGDTAGAMVEITEVVALVVLAFIMPLQ